MEPDPTVVRPAFLGPIGVDREVAAVTDCLQTVAIDPLGDETLPHQPRPAVRDFLSVVVDLQPLDLGMGSEQRGQGVYVFT